MPAKTLGRCVVAVDAGGTHTRASCFGLDGGLLGSATGPAGAWHHHDDAVENLRRTVLEALSTSGLSPGDAAALVAGVAGISSRGGADGDRSLDWAREHLALPELVCPQVFVNDAVTAHRGVLAGSPGVIVVAGTGSMVLAITARGEEVENGQLAHYAGAARHLVLDVVQQVLSARSAPQDGSFVAELMEALEVEDVDALRRTVLDLTASGTPHSTTRRLGPLAPLVTAAAETSPLADRALRALAERTAVGVLLLAPLVGTAAVPVGCTGSLATDPAFSSRLAAALAGSTCELQPGVTDPVRGAALMALELLGELDDAARRRLVSA
ncbi:BadF/BadG/BcrA/BcrD ATPase family protein [Quadrisphaera setariae]|uniref:BadF/BadG/BcrA/BcrD ATPase family protein n=1 Tax=Quadrisphaera setariae TaxID=2593304 RepID=UPI00164FB00B|nr:BadF/BadG/BcrA/BcrD ATPase family protein [Quadrisphaera setariae]